MYKLPVFRLLRNLDSGQILGPAAGMESESENGKCSQTTSVKSLRMRLTNVNGESRAQWTGASVAMCAGRDPAEDWRAGAADGQPSPAQPSPASPHCRQPPHHFHPAPWDSRSRTHTLAPAPAPAPGGRHQLELLITADTDAEADGDANHRHISGQIGRRGHNR